MRAVPKAASVWLFNSHRFSRAKALSGSAQAANTPTTGPGLCIALGLPAHMNVQRMTHSAQFQAVLGAKILAKTPHFALHQASLATVASLGARPRARGAPWSAVAPATMAPESMSSLWGTVTPKRWAKRAVTRNSIERQMLAVASGPGQLLPPAAYVLRQRAAFDTRQFPSARSAALIAAVRAELQALLRSAQRV